MKILNILVSNFASYEDLYFDFENQGLTLIQGMTGSGKSTLMDAIPWILFGKTAKGGLADEVLSWPGDKFTIGKIALDLNGKVFEVTRSRKPNDLQILDEDKYYRGKDLQDTQKIINETLGVDFELFLSAAYFHEFSQTAQFFTTTAKNRREICEQIVDLSFPINLQDKALVASKNNKNAINTLTADIKALETSILRTKEIQDKELTRVQNWTSQRKSRISVLEKSITSFEQNKSRRIEELITRIHNHDSKVCPTCGTQTNKEFTDPTLELLALEETKENPYVSQLQRTLEEVNPHSSVVMDFSDQLQKDEQRLSLVNARLLELSDEKLNLELLEDLTKELRATIIRNVILQIESSTNNILSDYFDAEFRVTLDIQNTDKLEVEITKDGNNAYYTQLSKGQRQILKLCFAVSVMKAASNSSGVSFNVLFFDEALSGLDDQFKSKAFRLLESVASRYESVFVIDHNESFKTMFHNKYGVELINGKSKIASIK